MKRIALALMLLSATAVEAQIKQITGGGYQNSNGTACAGCILYLQLPVDATVTGTGQIVPNINSYTLDTNGNVPANSNLWAVDQLTPTGLTYKATLTLAGGGRIWGPEFLSIAGASPISLTQLVPVASSSVFFGNPAILGQAANFTNLTVSGTGTFTTPSPGLISCRIENVRYVDSGNSCGWAGADAVAWIQSAANDLPAIGGVVDINLPTVITSTNAITIGSQTSQVTLRFHQASITFNGATGNGITINCRGCGIQGDGPLLSNLLVGGSFTGDLIHVEPASGQASVESVFVRGMRLDGTGASGGTYKLTNFLSARNVVVMDHVQLRNSSGRMINVGISANGGAAISEGITFSNVFVQQITAKTDDAVVLQGNRVVMWPNFNVSGTTLEGTKRCIVIITSANGEGRGITMGGSSSCSGYDKAVVVLATNVVPVHDLIIGPGMWFENFNEAIDLTGPNLANGVDHARISGNFYTQGTGAGTPWIRLDFAQLNTIDENISGGTGIVSLTANSNGNDIRLRSSSATLADVTDAGTANTISATTNSGGVAQTMIAGQFRVFRNNTLADQWDFLDSNALVGSNISTGRSAKGWYTDQGTICSNAELALSAGWQSTGSATVTAVQGQGQTCSWTITTGTTTAANPTVTDTLTNSMPGASTVCEMNIHGGTHTAAAGEGFNQTSLSATAPVFTFNGTPTAGGTTYFVTRRCGP